MKNTAAAIAEKMDEICKMVDDAIKDAAGERVGFTLMIWPAGRAIYGSNSEIASFLPGVKSFVEMWESGNVGIPLEALEDSMKNPSEYGIKE